MFETDATYVLFTLTDWIHNGALNEFHLMYF